MSYIVGQLGDFILQVHVGIARFRLHLLEHLIQEGEFWVLNLNTTTSSPSPTVLFNTMALKGTPQEGPLEPAKFRCNLFSSTSH